MLSEHKQYFYSPFKKIYYLLKYKKSFKIFLFSFWFVSAFLIVQSVEVFTQNGYLTKYSPFIKLQQTGSCLSFLGYCSDRTVR